MEAHVETGRNCSCCNKFKLWNEYDKKSTGINGRHSRCKSCIKVEKKKRWRKKNMKKTLAPDILIFQKSDLEEKLLSFSDQNKKDLEAVFRRLVFQSIINKGDKK